MLIATGMNRNLMICHSDMKSNTRYFIALICLLYIGYELGCFVAFRHEIRQLTKDKLRLEIQLLKIEIELNEIELQKEY